MEVVHVIGLFDPRCLFYFSVIMIDNRLTFSSEIRMVIFIKVAPVYRVVAL